MYKCVVFAGMIDRSRTQSSTRSVTMLTTRTDTYYDGDVFSKRTEVRDGGPASRNQLSSAHSKWK